ncbi:MAG: 23S rRNA (guanosine(2251)-2'-O)-methyltransferase RlmB [Calditrichaeota bacterium]|nr:MAG: 23S rRNA (guanosine(2251)-2'-O)-methyltransferase RlmB [Calditrichota bacterium]
MSSSTYIYGRRAVLEALSDAREVQKLYLQFGLRGEKVREIHRLARKKRIPISTVDARKLRQLVGDAAHQGVVALIAPVPIRDFADLVERMEVLPRPRTFLLLDRLQDPHNVGAILRSGEVFGVTGVILSLRETVPITEAVVKASAGAALRVPLFRAANPAQAVQELQEQGVWIYGAAPEAAATLWEVDFTRDCAILIGNEEKGLRPLLQKRCDQLFSIPRVGKVQSLNASVAAGIVLAEVLRQRLENRENDMQ